jgi:triacylglycerol esterase/lipase EstA (alpha/beta hydrolase family)
MSRQALQRTVLFSFAAMILLIGLGLSAQAAKPPYPIILVHGINGDSHGFDDPQDSNDLVSFWQREEYS